MNRFAEAAEAIAGTSRKTEKVRILADYLRSRNVDEAAVSAVFLSGRPFPAWEEATLQIGGSLLVRVILELSGSSEAALESAYRETGDLGAAARQLLSHRLVRPATGPSSTGPLCVLEAAQRFREIAAARGPGPKTAFLRRLLERATPLEAKYLIKITTGELRIGLKESLVEEAIAQAYGAPLQDVQRANMLLGDIGETVRLAVGRSLAGARMRMFHPLGFMLASPVDSATEAFKFFPEAQIEDKYDGIRAQAHCRAQQVQLFSRTLDDVTGAFPELSDPLSAFDGVILDGEIVAWDFTHGHALPFSELQKRLGRKKVTASMMRAVPVAYVVFDILYAGGKLLIDQPLRRRRQLLEQVFTEIPLSGMHEPQHAWPSGAGIGRPMAAHRARVRARDLQGTLAFEPAMVEDQKLPGAEPVVILPAPALRAESSVQLEQLFQRAQARGNEGLMIKDLDSVYTPGRRGRSWLKMKRELATLDVVVTAVEWGHGKRIGVLSDYTFAVLDSESSSANEPEGSSPEFLNVGKAYSGLTDHEIAQMTQWFLHHTVADHGFWREVEPEIVVEVAFNAVTRSGRHPSGYALRFPRILRLRPDKSAGQIDTLDRVREIYEKQQLPKIA